MSSYRYLLIVVVFFCSCKKDMASTEPEYLPKMKVKEFNMEVSKKYNFLSLDMDGNGFGDVNYSTYYNENMALPGYKLKFYGGGGKLVHFPLNANSSVQQTLQLRKGDRIDKNSFARPFEWNFYPFVLMATKNEPYFNKAISWEGDWTNVSHVYQAFAIEHPLGGLYYGWVELSMDTGTEKLMIHRAAMSLEPDKGVRAGYY